MNIEFTVISSNPSNEGKTFVWKLESVFATKAFGITKSVKRTFYIGNMPVAGEIGAKIVEDINRFEIKEREYAHPETGEVMLLKWLHVKPY